MDQLSLRCCDARMRYDVVTRACLLLRCRVHLGDRMLFLLFVLGLWFAAEDFAYCCASPCGTEELAYSNVESTGDGSMDWSPSDARMWSNQRYGVHWWCHHAIFSLFADWSGLGISCFLAIFWLMLRHVMEFRFRVFVDDVRTSNEMPGEYLSGPDHMLAEQRGPHMGVIVYRTARIGDCVPPVFNCCHNKWYVYQLRRTSFA